LNPEVVIAHLAQTVAGKRRNEVGEFGAQLNAVDAAIPTCHSN
jgi:hypothetical protein